MRGLMVAKIYDEAVLDRMRTRRRLATQRHQARKEASAAIANELDKLIAEGAPDYFTADQSAAYEEQLRRQRRRMAGLLGDAGRSNLANGGWPAHVQVWRG
jgi:hypothetical protein